MHAQKRTVKLERVGTNNNRGVYDAHAPNGEVWHIWFSSRLGWCVMIDGDTFPNVMTSKFAQAKKALAQQFARYSAVENLPVIHDTESGYPISPEFFPYYT